MDNATIIPMPSDYKISSQTEDIMNQVKGLGYEDKSLFSAITYHNGCRGKQGEFKPW